MKERFKKVLSLVITLSMLLSLIPATALAYTGESNSSTPIQTYYRYTPVANTNLSKGSGTDYFYSKTSIETDTFITTPLSIHHVEGGGTHTTNSDGYISSSEACDNHKAAVGYYYTRTEYDLVGIQASTDVEYDVGETLRKNDFTVTAFYSCTQNSIPSDSTLDQLKANNNWYVVELTGGFDLDKENMPDNGEVTVTYGKQSAKVEVGVKEYALNVSSDNGDAKFTQGDSEEEISSATKGIEVTLTVTPDEGYTIDSVTSSQVEVAKENESIYKFTVGTDDVNVTVNYNPGQYTITTKSTGQGSVTVPSTSQVAAGTEVEITATPNEGCVLSELNVFKTVEPNTVVPLDGNKFTMPGYDVTVEASFAEISSEMKDLNTILTGPNKTLSTGVYYLTNDLTLDGSNVGNGLKIASGAEVKIYLNGYTLSATGKDGTNGQAGTAGLHGNGSNSDRPARKASKANGAGGYAGIYLPSNSTLIFVGAGTVEAQGGAAGNGGNGGDGGNGAADAHGPGNGNDRSSGGGGGGGGAGGGGAGAGIGTNGTSSATATPGTAGTLIYYEDASGAITHDNIAGGRVGESGRAGTSGKGHDGSQSYLFTTDECSAQGGGAGGGGGGGAAGAAYGSGGQGGTSGTSGSSGSSDNGSRKYGTNSYAANGAEGQPGNSGSPKTADDYILKGLTVESKYSAVYQDQDVNDLIRNDAIDVWAYYNKAGDTFKESEALNGDYDNDDNWKLWKLKPLQIENGSIPTYIATVAKNKETEATEATITATYKPLNDGKRELKANWTATDTVKLGNNQAKDAKGAAVGGGDAVKYNDGKDVLKIDGVQGAAWEVQTYKNDDYKIGNGLTGMTNTGNKSYTVYYKPYNAYLYKDNDTMSADGRYLLGSASNFESYSELTKVAFRNAGLYTIVERCTRNDDQYTKYTNNPSHYDTTYYVVIEQADLQISNAIDTVTTNTAVQNHVFDRTVTGQNGEEVLGQYTFASNGETSRVDTYCDRETWKTSNPQNQSANEKTPNITGIQWEFNIKHTYNTEDINDKDENATGDRNMNNYLDQNDGIQVSRYMGQDKTIGGTEIDGVILKAEQNTFYFGSNGQLNYAGAGTGGVAVLTDNDSLTVQAKYENTQKITENHEGIDSEKTAWGDLKKNENVGDTGITSVFAEDVAFGATFFNSAYGFRVNKDDAVDGDIAGGTPITTIPDSIHTTGNNLSGNALFAKLVSDKQYQGDYYVVSVKKGDQVVQSWDYHDVSESPITSNKPVESKYALDKTKVWDAFEAGEYTVTVEYVGLYYQNNTGSTGREPGWSGTESFNWVTASKSFPMTIEKRNVAYKPMNDLYKVYDGTNLLVKDTLNEDGDVTKAGAYVIDLNTATTTTDSQFTKKAATGLYNFLQPKNYDSGRTTNLKLELAGNYDVNTNAGDNKTVIIANSRLKNPDEGDARNYNLIPVSNQNMTGAIYEAQMHVTHTMTGVVNVYDQTPMRKVLDLHVKAMMPPVDQPMQYTGGYLASEVTFKPKELVNKNDVAEGAASDYATEYQLVLNSKSDAYIYHQGQRGYTDNLDGFRIDPATGAVKQVAKLTSNNSNVDNFLTVTLTLKEFSGNYLIAKQDENGKQYPADKYGTCTNGTAKRSVRNLTDTTGYYHVKSGVTAAETLTHNIRYYIAGNGDTFNLYLPIDQLNHRGANSKFENAAGNTTIGENGKKYQYVTAYENGDQVGFSFTAPQDSYLEDLYIVTVDKGATIPAFADIKDIKADDVKVVGYFGKNPETGSISETYGDTKCNLKLELLNVNGKTPSTDNGYEAYKLAAPNDQDGGSTYSFLLTTGESGLGTGFPLVIVPKFAKFDPLLETGASVSVEKTLDSTSAQDDYIYVNYKTLYDTTAKDSTNTYGVIDMSYTVGDETKTLPQQTLDANQKDQTNSFGINTEDSANKAFFDPATLIPGTDVTVTVKVWRNGVVAGLQNVDSTPNDNDAMDTVQFTWKVSKEDYYRLFKDDVVVFRSSNEKEADDKIVTVQKTDNITGYAIISGNPGDMDFTKVNFVSADGTKDNEKNILTGFADTWYLVGSGNGTRKTIDPTTYTMSGLELGDNLYPTYEYATLQRVTTTNNTPETAPLGYARVIFGQIDLNNAFVYANAADVTVAPYSTSEYNKATKTSYTDATDLYWFDGWYQGSTDTVASAAVNGKITGCGAKDTYTLKEHINYVTFQDGSSVIGYGILDENKDTRKQKLDFTAVPFTATKPAVGTANSAASKNMTFTGEGAYSKSNYTLNGWYSDEALTTQITELKSVDCEPGDAFYLKSTYNAPSGGGGGGGGISAPSYGISTPSKPEHGTVTVSPAQAKKGDTVTITVTPDKGYTLDTITVTDANGKQVGLTDAGNGKYTFKMPDSKVTVAAAFKEAAAQPGFFVDVPADAYYYKAVQWAAENGITSGVDETHFAPMAITTRAQMVTFLWRAAGSPEPTTQTCAFTDVVKGSYYEKAVLWAVEQGITKGTSDTTFSPDEAVTRGQTVTFLARMNGVKDDATGYTHPFQDVSATDYYNNAVAWAATNKITDGTSATTFSPNDDCLRAQIVTFLYRNFVK